MKKRQKPLYLNRAISIIVLAGYSAFLILMLLLDWYLIREYQNENKRAEQAALNDYIDKTQDYMEKIDRQLYDIYVSDENFQALSRKEDELEEFGHAYELKETLNRRMLAQESMSGFFVFYDNRQKSWYYTNLSKVKSDQTNEIKQRLLNHLQNEGKMRSWYALTVDGDTNLAIYYEKDRVAVFGIHNMRNIEDEIQENMGKEVRVILMENGIALKNKELAGSLELDSIIKGYSDSFQTVADRHQVFGRRIPNTDVWVCTTYPLDLWSLMTIQQLLLLILTGISILAVCRLYVFVHREVVKPLHRLTDTMNSIRRGESREVPAMDARFYEIREVNNTLREMVEELEKQKMLVYEEIIEKQKAQMQYLQLQLKPHFYLNGLKTLNALALENQTDKMQDLILSLSVHLRYLLQTEREFVPLDMELKFVENYVELQKHISGRPVSCEIEKDKETDTWAIPVLAVYTFVENSVKYARLGGSSVPLEIRISAEVLSAEDGCFLDLIIRDNGQGYPEDTLEEINGDCFVGGQCVGINNIKRRCRILYGDKAEYSFTNCEGAQSELIIPERKQEDECTDHR